MAYRVIVLDTGVLPGMVSNRSKESVEIQALQLDRNGREARSSARGARVESELREVGYWKVCSLTQFWQEFQRIGTRLIQLS